MGINLSFAMLLTVLSGLVLLSGTIELNLIAIG